MRTIQTKDGITITDIPDDVPNTDPRLKAVVERLRAAGQKSASFNDVAASASAPAAAPGISQETAQQMTPDEVAALPAAEMGAAMEARGATLDPMGAMGAVVRGAGPVAAATALGAAAGSVIPGVGTVAGGAAGGGAMALSQFVGDPLVDLINGMFGTKLTRPTDALMQLFTSLGVPEPDTWAERILQAASAGAGGAAGSALLGEALSKAAKPLAPSVMKAIGDALAAGKVQQITGGIGSGLAGQGAAELGAPPLVQMGASVVGGVAGSKLGGTQVTPSALAKAPLEEAAEAGVRILPGDVNPPKTNWGKTISQRFDEILYGPGGLRSKQAAERTAAAQKLLTDLGANELAPFADDITADLLATRAGSLGKYTKAKFDVIDKVTGPVEMSQAAAVIDGALAELQQSGFSANKPIVNILKKWKGEIVGKSLRQIEEFRDIVRGAKADESLATVKSKSDKLFDAVYSAVKKDMGDSILKATGDPGQVAKWRDADRALKEMFDELKVPTLKSALTSGKVTPEITEKLLYSSNPSTVKLLYDNLSPAGRSAAESAIISRAAKMAGPSITPDALVRELRKASTQIGVFFPEDKLKQVEGFMRVIDFTKEAVSATSAPKTGMQLVPFAMYGGISAGLSKFLGTGIPESMAIGAGAVVGAGALARAYNSAFSWAVKNKEVRDILTKLPTLKVGSQEEMAAIHRLVSAMQVAQQTPGKPDTKAPTERTGTLYAK